MEIVTGELTAAELDEEVLFLSRTLQEMGVGEVMVAAWDIQPAAVAVPDLAEALRGGFADRLEPSKRYRIVELLLSEPVGHEYLPGFDIVGGAGAYGFGCCHDGHYFGCRDESQGDEEIPVWTSDQGADHPAKEVCFDLEVVLRATKYFCEYGKPGPGLTFVAPEEDEDAP